MMTASGIAANGPPALDDIRRIAAECVSPQLTAVLGADTELRFALIPVLIIFSEFSGYKGNKIFPSDKQKIP